jgi:hypothetical protein
VRVTVTGMPRLARLAGLLAIGAAAGCVLTLVLSHSPEPSRAAADSHAPPGAPMTWLPKQDWVMRHWLPYDEARLYGLLGVNRRTVATWLRTHGHTLAQLAAEHGHGDVDALARDLVGEDDATLIGRAEDTLTQSHLAQHVLFHSFHDPQLPAHAQQLFGVSTAEFRKARRSGRTPREIGAQGGRSAAQVTNAVEAFLHAEQQAGVRQGATSPEQAEATAAEQIARVPMWLDRAPGAHKGHGGHRHG